MLPKANWSYPTNIRFGAGREFARAVPAGVKQAEPGEIGQPERPARRCSEARDVPERVGPFIAERLGIGRGADAERIQDQYECSCHSVTAM